MFNISKPWKRYVTGWMRFIPPSFAWQPSSYLFYVIVHHFVTVRCFSYLQYAVSGMSLYASPLFSDMNPIAIGHGLRILLYILYTGCIVLKKCYFGDTCQMLEANPYVVSRDDHRHSLHFPNQDEILDISVSPFVKRECNNISCWENCVCPLLWEVGKELSSWPRDSGGCAWWLQVSSADHSYALGAWFGKDPDKIRQEKEASIDKQIDEVVSEVLSSGAYSKLNVMYLYNWYICVFEC